VAIEFPDCRLTYSELRDEAHVVAAGLAGRSRVAVLAEPRAETCVAVIGALLAGIPVVPLNPRSGPSELGHVLADAQPDAVLLAPGSEAPPGLEPVVLELGRHGSGPLPPAPPYGSPDPEDPALIVYTSGTTGPPKGAVLPRRAIASNLDALAVAWGWTEEDTVIHGLPLFHVHGLVIGVLGPIRRAGAVSHVGRFSPESVERALDAGGQTMLFGVPTMYRRLADAAERSSSLAQALAGARLLVSGSAALPTSEHKRLEQLTGRGVVERYGMTETLMNTAIRFDGEPAPGTVGAPVDGVELRLVDDDGEAMGARDGQSIGEIEVRGSNLFLGYLNRPDATEAAMHEGWFRTGDMATIDERGYVRIVGRRATDLIKSGGYKIGAGEIEGSLREHPGVDDAAVTAEPDDDLGQRIVAWVVLHPGARADPEELIEHVASDLAPHKRPRVIRFLDELPRNELGKVQKQRLTSNQRYPGPR
jgi:malonyl-CoA/methylmalonyl-CoA synthetase